MIFEYYQFLHSLMNQQRNFLVTIGEDDQVAPQQSTLCLKVFDLDKMQDEGSSTTNPECVGILRIFTNQFPKAKVNDTVVHACYAYVLLGYVYTETRFVT